MPPWSLPDNKTQSGILTRSSKGGAPGAGLKDGVGDANALRFEDLAGKEQLWLHAQKDQLTEVENDEDKWVGRDRRKTIDRDELNHIQRDRTERWTETSASTFTDGVKKRWMAMRRSPFTRTEQSALISMKKLTSGSTRPSRLAKRAPSA